MELFVPGRLCLFGEHSDWAGTHNRSNSQIESGMAIVTGIDQGIFATADKDKHIRFRTVLPEGGKTSWQEWPLSVGTLIEEAETGGFYSYVAGVAAYMLQHYDVGGLTIDCHTVTIPLAKGLSSSAAICVLVVRAFNQLYNLQLTVRGEMEAAYRGEIITPSRCGRLDQACAYGKKPILMKFNGESMKVERLAVGRELYWVIADLGGNKNTPIILAALNACYPFAHGEIAQNVQRALGSENKRIVTQVIDAIKKGDAKRIGELMDEAQRVFDELVAPACPDQLTSPLLHKVMSDKTVRALSLGVKGVGSQGDGTAQMICESPEKQRQLRDYLQNTLGMNSYVFAIPSQRAVRKAIIPVAGLGTRLFPATKAIKKELLPILDRDGIFKPALMVQLEELYAAGIEEIALIIRPDERAMFDCLFSKETAPGVYEKLPAKLRKYNTRMQIIGQRITYITQEEQRGFGHAVYQARDFVGDDPVLLMLGDHIFRSDSAATCAQQLIEVYESMDMLTLAIDEVDADMLSHYGIIGGSFLDDEEHLMNILQMAEKPTLYYAQNNLSVRDKRGKNHFYCVFGQYILTPQVFKLLEQDITSAGNDQSEIELTPVLAKIARTNGMIGYRPSGRRFDIGLPEAYRKTLASFDS